MAFFFAVTEENVDNMNMCFYTIIVIDGVFHGSRIKYDATQNNYLNFRNFQNKDSFMRKK